MKFSLEYLATASTCGETKEISFRAKDKPSAKRKIADSIANRIHADEITEADEKIIIKNGKQTVTISDIHKRPSYILCGECKYFKSDGCGLEYEGICLKDGKNTTNLRNCRYKVYYFDKEYTKGQKKYDNCLMCGKVLTDRHTKYCSNECKHRYLYEEQKEEECY